MAGTLKYGVFTRVNDKWRFESWLVEGIDFRTGDAEARIHELKKEVEKECGPGSLQTFAFIDGANQGKAGTPTYESSAADTANSLPE